MPLSTGRVQPAQAETSYMTASVQPVQHLNIVLATRLNQKGGLLGSRGTISGWKLRASVKYADPANNSTSRMAVSTLTTVIPESFSSLLEVLAGWGGDLAGLLSTWLSCFVRSSSVAALQG